MNNILKYFIFYNKIIIWVIPLVIILIGFHGYLNPYQTRVFGDTYPQQIQSDQPNFEFYKVDFNDALTPNYYAPYRYRIDKIGFMLSKNLSKNLIQWLINFFLF